MKKPSPFAPFLIALLIAILLAGLAQVFPAVGFAPGRLIICMTNLGVSNAVLPDSEKGRASFFVCPDGNGLPHPYSPWLGMAADTAVYFVILSIGFLFIFLSGDSKRR